MKSISKTCNFAKKHVFPFDYSVECGGWQSSDAELCSRGRDSPEGGGRINLNIFRPRHLHADGGRKGALVVSSPNLTQTISFCPPFHHDFEKIAVLPGMWTSLSPTWSSWSGSISVSRVAPRIAAPPLWSGWETTGRIWAPIPFATGEVLHSKITITCFTAEVCDMLISQLFRYFQS